MVRLELYEICHYSSFHLIHLERWSWAFQSENVLIFLSLSIPRPRKPSPREVTGFLEVFAGFVYRVPEVCRAQLVLLAWHGSGVGLVSGPLLSRGAADIFGKAILLIGVSGALAP